MGRRRTRARDWEPRESHAQAIAVRDDGGAPFRPPDFDAAVTHSAADQVVVAVHGEIDVASAERFRQIVEAAILPGARLVIDLAGTNFVDSTGLGVMAQA